SRPCQRPDGHPASLCEALPARANPGSWPHRLGSAAMSELQSTVAAAADAASAHSTAPALLVQAVAALGRLAQTTDRATESGRRPFRIPHDWAAQLAELSWLSYLLADQTGVDLDA